jgi:hypothetical protein
MALLVAIWREWLREVEMMDEAASAAAAPVELEGGPRQIEVTAPEAKKIQAG